MSPILSRTALRLRRALAARTITCLMLLRPALGFADVLPPDQCNVEGASCANAGPSARSPGICASARCTKYFPVYPDASGGGGGPSFELHEYDCLRCVSEQPADAGRESADAGNAAAGINDAGCGCGLPGATREASLALIMACLGLLALRSGRRR
ncbi:MAG TPA: hypothetical protein VG963_19475 [Polyangiaceae bacterium]|nr:hypothetical protein [Polyangiaceae bacterium]